MIDEFKGVAITALFTSTYASWIPYLTVRIAEEGCAQWHLSTYPRIEKSYHLKPTMIREKNVGYHNHDLKTFFLHPNLTLLDNYSRSHYHGYIQESLSDLCLHRRIYCC